MLVLIWSRADLHFEHWHRLPFYILHPLYALVRSTAQHRLGCISLRTGICDSLSSHACSLSYEEHWEKENESQECPIVACGPSWRATFVLAAIPSSLCAMTFCWKMALWLFLRFFLATSVPPSFGVLSFLVHRIPARWACRSSLRPLTALRAGDDGNENQNDFSKNYNNETDSKIKDRHNHWVVLVDDEESIRLPVGDYLYEQGYQVSACADADALLYDLLLAQNNNTTARLPDVIVSDVRMPGGKHGLELVRLLRQRQYSMPVILLTAKALTQDRIDGYQAGADYFLPKPFDPEELLAVVDNAIRRSREMMGPLGKLVADLKHQIEALEDVVDPQASKQRRRMLKNKEDGIPETSVTIREKDRKVLNLVCQGLTNAEMAQARGVSASTIADALKRLYDATGTRSKTDLVRWAVETGNLPVGDSLSFEPGNKDK